MQIPSVKLKLKGNEMHCLYFTICECLSKKESMSGALKTINKLEFYIYLH